LEKACNLTYVNKGEATMISKRKRRNKGLGWRRKGESRMVKEELAEKSLD
jgi:hypothetical protein